MVQTVIGNVTDKFWAWSPNVKGTALTEWAVWLETEVDKTTRIVVAGDRG